MPRKRKVDSDDQRERIQFSYNADKDKPMGVVFEYLLQNERIPARMGKNKGLEAISAFWKPFAYQEKGNLSEEEVLAIARESLSALTRQIDAICQAFNLEHPQTTQVSPALKQAIQESMGEVLQQFIVTGVLAKQTGGSPSASAQPEAKAIPQEDGVDFDEQSLLGELMDESETAA